MSRFILIPTKLEARYIPLNDHIIVSGLCKKTLNTLNRLSQEHKLEHLVLVGFAGDLSGEHKVGDVFSITSVSDKKDVIAVKPFPPFNRTASMITVNRPIFTKARRNDLVRHAELVDMEGYYFAKFCNDHNIKFNIVRMISDSCDTHFRKLITELKIHQQGLVDIVKIIERRLF